VCVAERGAFDTHTVTHTFTNTYVTRIPVDYPVPLLRLFIFSTQRLLPTSSLNQQEHVSAQVPLLAVRLEQ
jgi:hypothetical protein